jgi:hypothetical protein
MSEKMNAELKEYTLEIYKKDKRKKNGIRLFEKLDFGLVTKDYIEEIAQNKRNIGFVVKVFETYVTKTNLMSREEFKERYDVPYFCSPSSETYWSM